MGAFRVCGRVDLSLGNSSVPLGACLGLEPVFNVVTLGTFSRNKNHHMSEGFLGTTWSPKEDVVTKWQEEFFSWDPERECTGC